MKASIERRNFKDILWGSRFAMHTNDRGFELGYKMANGEKANQDEENPFGDINNIYDEISNDHEFLQGYIGELKAVYQAFNEVCTANNINASQLITWFDLFVTLP